CIRGILGAGTNRLNIYTDRKAMKGLALYLEENSVNVKDRGIVIAYDSRHQSREFALEAAKVFGVHGIRTYIFEELRPTPLLSYAVRSEEHTSELQSRFDLVCRLLLEKKNNIM